MNAICRAASYRAVFISDTHLGTGTCRSDFLARTRCEHMSWSATS